MDDNNDEHEDFCFPAVVHRDSFKTSGRAVCDRCGRPTPKVCICSVLPLRPLVLRRSRLHVLVHPKEAKTTNRSWPAVGLVLSSSSFTLTKGWRFPSTPNIFQNEPALLLYPGPNALTLDEALDKIQRRRTDTSKPCLVQLVVLDATWRLAKDMHKFNLRAGVYPRDLIQVQLRPVDFGAAFRPRRFCIRTPPSEDHFSSAEAIAFSLSKIEEDSSMYELMMKPLDLMVNQWNAHILQQAKRNP